MRWLGPTTSATRSCGKRIPVSTSGCRARARRSRSRASTCCRVRRSAGIVVNVAELRMYYFPAQSGPLPEGVAPGSRRVITHPISIGRMDWSTPLGVTTITGKVANPSWYPPQSIRDEHAARNDILPRVVPPGPDNPLGLACDASRLAGILDPWHEQAVRRRHASHARLRAHVPRGYRSALQDGADRHVSQHRQPTGEDRLDGRRHAVSGSSSGAHGEQRRRRELWQSPKSWMLRRPSRSRFKSRR